jgi:hypothetical protein
MHRLKLTLTTLLLGLLVLAALPSVVLALAASPAPHLVLPVAQIWVVVVGLLSPLVGYVVNSNLWKTAPEPVKAFVQVVIAAVAAAITTAISTSVFGLNAATLQLIITGVVAALSSHALLWRPSGIAAHLAS